MTLTCPGDDDKPLTWFEGCSAVSGTRALAAHPAGCEVREACSCTSYGSSIKQTSREFGGQTKGTARSLSSFLSRHFGSLLPSLVASVMKNGF